MKKIHHEKRKTLLLSLSEQLLFFLPLILIPLLLKSWQEWGYWSLPQGAYSLEKQTQRRPQKEVKGVDRGKDVIILLTLLGAFNRVECNEWGIVSKLCRKYGLWERLRKRLKSWTSHPDRSLNVSLLVFSATPQLLQITNSLIIGSWAYALPNFVNCWVHHYL